MNIFYATSLLSDTYQLNESESKHCVRVLRLAVGDKLFLVDGKGTFAEATIFDAHAKRCIVQIISRIREYNRRDYCLHIAIAPTKNIDRFEWFLEKATEIGIDTITPIISDHSERKIIKPERLEKVIKSAMKQSVKAYLPHLNLTTKFSNFLESTKNDNALKFIAHCTETEKHSISKNYKPNQNVTILIGPEGDFSPREIAIAEESGYKYLSLGNSRLRTETAGVVACAQVAFMNQE